MELPKTVLALRVADGTDAVDPSLEAFISNLAV
jgi:hypothetical protein